MPEGSGKVPLWPPSSGDAFESEPISSDFLFHPVAESTLPSTQKVVGATFAKHGDSLDLQRTGEATFTIKILWKVSGKEERTEEILKITLKKPPKEIKEQFLAALLVAKTYRQGVIDAYRSCPSRYLNAKIDELRANLTSPAPSGKELVAERKLSKGKLLHTEHQSEKAYAHFLKSQSSLQGYDLPPRLGDSQLREAKVLLEVARVRLKELRREAQRETGEARWVSYPPVVDTSGNIVELENLLRTLQEHPAEKSKLEPALKDLRANVAHTVKELQQFISGIPERKSLPQHSSRKASSKLSRSSIRDTVHEAKKVLSEAEKAMKKFKIIQQVEAQEAEKGNYKNMITNGVNEPNLTQMDKAIHRAANRDPGFVEDHKLLKSRFIPQAKELIDFVASSDFQAKYQSLPQAVQNELDPGLST